MGGVAVQAYALILIPINKKIVIFYSMRTLYTVFTEIFMTFTYVLLCFSTFSLFASYFRCQYCNKHPRVFENQQQLAEHYRQHQYLLAKNVSNDGNWRITTQSSPHSVTVKQSISLSTESSIKQTPPSSAIVPLAEIPKRLLTILNTYESLKIKSDGDWAHSVINH